MTSDGLEKISTLSTHCSRFVSSGASSFLLSTFPGYGLRFCVASSLVPLETALLRTVSQYSCLRLFQMRVGFDKPAYKILIWWRQLVMRLGTFKREHRTLQRPRSGHSVQSHLEAELEKASATQHILPSRPELQREWRWWLFGVWFFSLRLYFFLVMLFLTCCSQAYIRYGPIINALKSWFHFLFL